MRGDGDSSGIIYHSEALKNFVVGPRCQDLANLACMPPDIVMNIFTLSIQNSAEALTYSSLLEVAISPSLQAVGESGNVPVPAVMISRRNL